MQGVSPVLVGAHIHRNAQALGGIALTPLWLADTSRGYWLSLVKVMCGCLGGSRLNWAWLFPENYWFRGVGFYDLR